MGTWQILLLVALVVCGGIVALVLWNKGRGQPALQKERAAHEPGAAAAAASADPVAVQAYNPHKIGNDAAARPWDSFTVDFDVSEETRYTADAADKEAELLAKARSYFIAMQRAWDSADMNALSGMMTPAMEASVHERLLERQQSGPSVHEAEIMVLEARYLGQNLLDDQRVASIEFSGMVRETHDAAPTPFREIWMLAPSPADASKWLVAGVESLGS